MEWLNEVPICVVNAHLAMLSPLQAEETRVAATVVGVGRSMKPGPWARRQIASWDSAARARPGQPRQGVPMNAGIKVKRHG